jgi:hypothetical protein
MSTAPIFNDFAKTVLATRKDEGVRGVKHEWNRFRTHIECAPFAQKPLDEIERRDIREWVRDMRLKKAQDHRGDRFLDDATIKRAYALVVCGPREGRAGDERDARADADRLRDPGAARHVAGVRDPRRTGHLARARDVVRGRGGGVMAAEKEGAAVPRSAEAQNEINDMETK